jgi:hypothetical protein
LLSKLALKAIVGLLVTFIPGFGDRRASVGF